MRSSTPVLLALAALLAVAPATLDAQTPPRPAQPVGMPVPPANPADVESVDAIVAALYDVISGPAGEARDWNRMRSLFVPRGRLVPTVARPGGATGVLVWEVNDYIATSGAMLEQVGFQEIEIARTMEVYGNIAHVFSTYEARMETDPSIIRGINSIQLLNDGERWWVLSVYWQAETPDNPIPARYLPGS